jgi:diketogulonate reductase-like aldo/keto reductase
MAMVTKVTLNNGVQIPAIGLGLAMLGDEAEAESIVSAAVEKGYRLFDNAPLYGSEKAAGKALRTCGLPRGELFISNKLPTSQPRFEDALKAFDASAKALGVDYLDMYLIHFPVPAENRFPEAWKALEKLYQEGYVRAIGVSNFLEHHLETLSQSSETIPVVNQLECNPYLSIAPLRKYCTERGIRPEAWFPLGGPAVSLNSAAPDKILLEDPDLAELAQQYDRTIAQIILRWEVQSGIITVPKSSKPKRLAENIDIFDFSLSDADMARIDALDYGRRIGPHPDECNDLF